MSKNVFEQRSKYQQNMTMERLLPSTVPYLLVLLSALLTSLCFCVTEAEVLNEYIQHYEPLHYDHHDLHQKHTRMKGALDSHFVWDFQAYGRSFQLRLYPAESVFAEDHTMEFGDDSAKPVDTSFIYDGYITDQPGSSAHVSIRPEGVTGYVKVPGDTTYHIEPARNHFRHNNFHTIIYPESRINLDPFRHLRSGSCGGEEWFDMMRNRSKHLEEIENSQQGATGSRHKKYSPIYNDLTRHKRQTSPGNIINPNKTRCSIYMRVDNLLYNHMLSKSKDLTGERSNEEQTREEILTFFASHVTFLTDTYKDVKFSLPGGDTYIQGINFQIQKTAIMTSCGTGTAQWESSYCTDNLDVSHFLELTARRNQNEFCLTYTFTYRDFLQGVLGLAYLGMPDSSAAGICGRNSRTQTAGGSIELISQNTGIVTLVNFQREVPSIVSKLTFAHEVGHNFGSTHDTANTKCAPYNTQLAGAENGNFIMFPSASQGSLSNNFLFSECSKEDIYKVLSSFEPNGRKYDCFESSDKAVCGNTVKETGEECDCGYEEDCASVDQCCEPRSQDGSSGCTLLPKTVCSPSDGPCCSKNCSFVANTVQCRQQSECMGSANCDGNSSQCPASTIAENYQTFCNEYTAMCLDGNCVGSICKREGLGWEECYKTDAEGSGNKEMCHVSCKNNVTGQCISTFDESLFDSIFGSEKPNVTSDGSTGVTRPPGSLCNAFLGYCDSLTICQPYDAEGPFRRLLGNIFGSDDWTDVTDWMKDNWWVVLLASAAAIGLLILLMRLFTHHTPEHDPKRPPPPTASTHERRAPNSNRADKYAVETSKPTHDAIGADNQRRQTHHNRRTETHDHSGRPRNTAEVNDRSQRPRRSKRTHDVDRSERPKRPAVDRTSSDHERPKSDHQRRQTSRDQESPQRLSDNIRDRGVRGRSLHDDTDQGYRFLGGPPSYPAPTPPGFSHSYETPRDHFNDNNYRNPHGAFNDINYRHSYHQPDTDGLHSPSFFNHHNN